MRLTSFTDYALRMLIYVALKPGSIATIGEISAAYGISKNHLMKIANSLSQAGYLRSIRGRHGGICLARPAQQINIGKVVRMTEAGTALVECCDPGTNTCIITRACKLKHVLRLANEDFYERLEQTSLADLVDAPNGLLMLLPKMAA